MTADWLSGFTRRFKGSVDPSKVSANVSNFQPQIRIAADAGYNDVDLTRLFDDLKYARNGEQMIAVTLADGTTQVPVEIARWDWVAREAHLWVGPAALDAIEGLGLYLYWNNAHPGNGDYLGDRWSSGDPTAPWDDSAHLLVNHMADGPAVVEVADELTAPLYCMLQGVASDGEFWYFLSSQGPLGDESGVNTAIGANTLTDTGKAWNADEWLTAPNVTYVVCDGKSMAITGNTATQLTGAAGWTKDGVPAANPGVGEFYSINQQVYGTAQYTNTIRKYSIATKQEVAVNDDAYPRAGHAFSTGCVIDGVLMVVMRDEGGEDDARVVEYDLDDLSLVAGGDHDIAYDSYQYPEGVAKHSIDGATDYYWVMFGANGNANESGTNEGAATGPPGTLTDTDKAWTPNEWVGKTVTCNGKSMVVASNTPTVLTGTAGWSGGGNPGFPFRYYIMVYPNAYKCAVIRYDLDWTNPVAYDLFDVEKDPPTSFGGQDIKFISSTDFLLTPHGDHGGPRKGHLERWHWNGSGFEFVRWLQLPDDAGTMKLGQGFDTPSRQPTEDDETWYFATRASDPARLVECAVSRYADSLLCPDSSTNSDVPNGVSVNEATSPTQEDDDETGHRQDFESTGNEKLQCGQGSQLRSFSALTIEVLISVESFLVADEGKNTLVYLQRGPMLQVRGDGNNVGKVAFYGFGLSDVGYHFSQAADGVPAPSPLAVATLYHILLSYDGATIRLYIDGVEDTTGDFPVAATGTTTFMAGDYHSIGCQMSPGVLRFFDGRMMEVRVADDGKSGAWALASNHNMKDTLLDWGELETNIPVVPDTAQIQVLLGDRGQSLPRMAAEVLRQGEQAQVE